MKLFVHASIFSVVFAGFVASAVTTKPTDHVTASHSLVVSHAMPVPTCPPGEAGCGALERKAVLTLSPAVPKLCTRSTKVPGLKVFLG